MHNAQTFATLYVYFKLYNTLCICVPVMEKISLPVMNSYKSVMNSERRAWISNDPLHYHHTHHSAFMYLLNKEKGQQSAVTHPPNCFVRPAVCEWVMDLCHTLNFTTGLFTQTMMIYDKVRSSTCLVNVDNVQLVAATCFALAAKLSDDSVCDRYMLNKLAYLSADTFTTEDVVASEGIICKMLNWNINLVQPQQFIMSFLYLGYGRDVIESMKSAIRNKNYLELLYDAGEFQKVTDSYIPIVELLCQATFTASNINKWLPSVIAVGCIEHTLERSWKDFDCKAFRTHMKEYVSLRDLDLLKLELAKQ